MQERRYSIANALELCLSCTNTSIYNISLVKRIHEVTGYQSPSHASPWFPRMSSHRVDSVTPVSLSSRSYSVHSQAICSDPTLSSSFASVRSPRTSAYQCNDDNGLICHAHISAFICLSLASIHLTTFSGKLNTCTTISFTLSKIFSVVETINQGWGLLKLRSDIRYLYFRFA